MKKYRAIPEEYMTTGEVAKKMNVSVRTLQYYDKEGLFSPSAESEGGRRLYTDKDVIKLHQILSLKHLGFSLDDIKNRLLPMDTPANVADVLTQQSTAIREKIESLSISLKDLEALKEEVLQIQQVDFKKYADIIKNLQMKNEFYWLIKHFDDNTIDFFRNRFDKDSAALMIETITRLNEKAIGYQKDNVLPESEAGQAFAKAFWDMIIEFTNGDITLIPKLLEIENIDNPDKEWKQKHEMANAFIQPALGVYFANLGINPFEEMQE